MSLSNEMNVITIPTHLVATAITFLTNYHNSLTNTPTVSVWYETNVLGCIKHLQEVLDEHNISCTPTSEPSLSSEEGAGFINKHLHQEYQILLCNLSVDLGNTEIMDKIKAFKLVHPDITEQY